MIKALLILHITLGLTSISYAVLISLKTHADVKKVSLTSVKRMWYSLTGVAVSGFTLTALSHASFGNSCKSLTVFALVVLFAHLYQRNAHRRAGISYPDKS